MFVKTVYFIILSSSKHWVIKNLLFHLLLLISKRKDLKNKAFIYTLDLDIIDE